MANVTSINVTLLLAPLEKGSSKASPSRCWQLSKQTTTWSMC